jgi:hypothetical protein
VGAKKETFAVGGSDGLKGRLGRQEQLLFVRGAWRRGWFQILDSG